MTNGRVMLVGAGPGDAGLLTVKGLRCLEQADAIVYDRLASPRLLSHAKSDVELYYAGKSADNHTLTQTDIEQLLISLAKRGLNVVRLKGGDPFVFGRGAEEASALREAGVPWEVVPGITSAVSVPAYAGIPVTVRHVSPSFTVVTGHRAPEGDDIDWHAYAKEAETLIILMGVRQLPSIVQGLMGGGKSGKTPIALIRWGTRAKQETLVGTLHNIVEKVQELRFQSPAVIVVGEVVCERDRLAWYEQLPLMGKRIFLAANTKASLMRMAEAAEALGAETFGLCIEQLTTPDGDEMNRVMDAIADGAEKTGLYFRTPNAVSLFFLQLRSRRLDLRRFSFVSFGACDPHVASALETYGVFAEGVGPRVFGDNSIDTWWCEASVSTSTDADRIAPLSSFASNSRICWFRPLHMNLQAPWLNVARDWLADRCDVVWTTGHTSSITDALSAELQGDVIRLEAVSDANPAVIVDVLSHRLWQDEQAGKTVGAL